MPDRARKRAIRALAAELGVAYSVAARVKDEHRALMFAARERRTFLARVRDSRQAAELPLGRAAHLVTRFPAMRAEALYSGEGRETAIAMLYAVVEHESPDLLPPKDELAWAAGLGEDAGVDVACAAVDRAARLLLDGDRWRLWVRIEAALTAGETNPDRRVRDAAITLGRELRSTSLRSSMDAARQILDALLVEAYGGLPPGVKVRVGGETGTVVGARWERSGPPSDYLVHLDGVQVTAAASTVTTA
ncbi:hypothetical protein SAMN05421748_12629 [Paractinoplanes atraurantiacus]|uniref:Uncharacterized protein n=1 Tax=Paractinoplanes atraurantiacus TaxID=1036182 RepID=A0A285JUP1_9ACTN|nr:hypothetical protein SAMN05421748_12629 [Actinoplanes atraurantiacus]